MKICLVTTFPPSTGGLSEYGFHIAQELQRNPFLSLTVLADQLDREHEEPEGFTVLRCWSFDDPFTIFRLIKTIRRLQPDVVWFNLLFSTFGRNPFAAFSGLMTPLVARLGGRYTHVTLHHLMDTVELKDAGVRCQRLYRAAGAVATRMLLLSNSVSVLMPSYRKILNDKYGRDNVHLRAHGLLARRPEFPDLSRRGTPVHRILAFGKWGTYKRLELMIDAFNLLAQKLPQAQLVIAGGDHPQAAGYVESVRKRHEGNSGIEFLGYVPESDLADLFQSSSVTVMPYSSSTGCSGVAHLACAFGVPIVSADLVDFRQMGQSEELAIEFFPPGSAQGLADCLYGILTSPERQYAMATQNFSAALRMTMPNVVQKYLRHFELQQRVKTLQYVSRIRRLPRWIPSKSLLLRLLTRDSLRWSRRSVVLHAMGGDLLPPTPVHADGERSREMGGPLVPVNGQDVAVPQASRRNGTGALPCAGPCTGDRDDHHCAERAPAYQPQDATPTDGVGDDNSARSEREEPAGVAESRPFMVAGGSVVGNDGDGENRAGGARSWENGRGGE